jgi:alkylation response protein AidB-like acyl-CoA dehydrogenase
MLQGIPVKETNVHRLQNYAKHERGSVVAMAKQLGPRFAERAARADEGDLFVGENFSELKAHGLVAAGVPKELQGGGASHAELCEMLRELGRYCGSTALAFSMHTHQVATAAWRWRHQGASVDSLLKRVAIDKIVILSSGGSDWLQGSGTATRVDGGFRINARKIFASGAPAGDLLMTSAIYDDPEAGPSVLHFAVSMKAEGIKVLDTWRVMGMRGTGSHDIELTGVFIPDSAIRLKRPQGKWHLLFHVISMIAIPLIYSVYVGIAEAARDLAVKQIIKRRADGHAPYLIGGMENELVAVRLALQEMIVAAATNDPDFVTTNRVMIGRTLVARGVLKIVALAMEAAGGGAFYRSVGLERLFRDAQACRYHPLQEDAQRAFTGKLALGQDVDAA